MLVSAHYRCLQGSHVFSNEVSAWRALVSRGMREVLSIWTGGMRITQMCVMGIC